MLSLVRSGNGANPGEILDQILGRVGDFHRRQPQQDDLTIMLARYTPCEPDQPEGSRFDLRLTGVDQASAGLLGGG